MLARDLHFCYQDSFCQVPGYEPNRAVIEGRLAEFSGSKKPPYCQSVIAKGEEARVVHVDGLLDEKEHGDHHPQKLQDVIHCVVSIELSNGSWWLS